MSHYPGHAVVYPTIALLVASISDATISVLGSGKRSDKQKISPLPVVLLAAHFFAVALMSNAARYSVSRIIGVDAMFYNPLSNVSHDFCSEGIHSGSNDE